MRLEDIALFPYLNESSVYISKLDISPESLATSRAFEKARRRAINRIEGVLSGDLSKPASFSNESEILVEILSYIYARILISSVNEAALIRKFALQEAIFAHDTILKNKDLIPEISKDLGFIFKDVEIDSVAIHFTDYIKYSLSLKNISSKMVNKRVESGFVTITHNEVARLIQEAIRIKIEFSLPATIPDDLQELCSNDIKEVETIFNEFKKDYVDTDFGEIMPGLFPPCIRKALTDVKSGVNLAHSMRFALVSFLYNIGMGNEDIINAFNVSPDFDYEKTSYQVNHISKNEYKCPACSTMVTYGNCFGKDEICEKIKHPLGYYSRKIYFSKNPSNTKTVKAKEEKEETEKEISKKEAKEKEIN
ncbi:MAG: DNA primase large subunit PriL [Methanosarcinaceae archaeon]|nr:DNA primase large subunit PriL [Methanosarcinaceae archaeon]